MVRNAIAGWITETLARSPTFEGRPDRMQVEGALERVARNVLLQRDFTDEPTRPIGPLRSGASQATAPIRTGPARPHKPRAIHTRAAAEPKKPRRATPP